MGAHKTMVKSEVEIIDVFWLPVNYFDIHRDYARRAVEFARQEREAEEAIRQIELLAAVQREAWRAKRETEAVLASSPVARLIADRVEAPPWQSPITRLIES